MNLYDRVCAIAREKDLAISKIERECNLSNATIRRWATQNPSLDSVQKVAHYLNVSIDFLAGNSEQAQFSCDGITMFYEQATGKKGSIYSTYIEDEYKQTSGPAEGGNRSGIA